MRFVTCFIASNIWQVSWKVSFYLHLFISGFIISYKSFKSSHIKPGFIFSRTFISLHYYFHFHDLYFHTFMSFATWFIASSIGQVSRQVSWRVLCWQSFCPALWPLLGRGPGTRFADGEKRPVVPQWLLLKRRGTVITAGWPAWTGYAASDQTAKTTPA